MASNPLYQSVLGESAAEEAVYISLYDQFNLGQAGNDYMQRRATAEASAYVISSASFNLIRNPDQLSKYSEIIRTGQDPLTNTGKAAGDLVKTVEDKIEETTGLPGKVALAVGVAAIALIAVFLFTKGKK